MPLSCRPERTKSYAAWPQNISEANVRVTPCSRQPYYTKLFCACSNARIIIGRSETHVIAFAARAMRRILISYGVARTRDKRGGPSVVRLPLDEALDFC